MMGCEDLDGLQGKGLVGSGRSAAGTAAAATAPGLQTSRRIAQVVGSSKKRESTMNQRRCADVVKRCSDLVDPGDPRLPSVERESAMRGHYGFSGLR
jgi:hypothetical protein